MSGLVIVKFLSTIDIEIIIFIYPIPNMFDTESLFSDLDRDKNIRTYCTCATSSDGILVVNQNS